MTWLVSEFVCALDEPLVEVPVAEILDAPNYEGACEACELFARSVDCFKNGCYHRCTEKQASKDGIIYMRQLDAITFKLTGELP